MPMVKLIVLISLYFSFFCNNINAQNYQVPKLNFGDIAPPLYLGKILKGNNVKKFEKGNFYVIEFWATWCKPCIAAMPHLSILSRKYKNVVTFLAINVYEQMSKKTDNQVQAFVDSMGSKMDYNVALQESNLMESEWLDASGGQGIPVTFIVNDEGKIAWIGHPRGGLDSVLTKVLNKTWNIKEALQKRNDDKYLAMLDDSLRFELLKYSEYVDYQNKIVLGNPDSVISAINDIIKIEPRLKYAPLIGSNTFKALLRKDQELAYKFGKELLQNKIFDEPAYYVIIDQIDWYSDKLTLLPKIYNLGTEAYEMKISKIVPEQFIDLAPKFYHIKADWHIRANDPLKAIESEQLAIDILKRNKNLLLSDLKKYENKLKEYKKTLF